ncbi:hypothetical protein ACWEO1_01230 [Kitasatospora cineracea]
MIDNVRVRRGRVSLTVPVEVWIPSTDPATGESWLRTLRCPQCQAVTGLSLRADGRSGEISCGSCGLAFTDPAVDGSAVRQTFAVHQKGVATGIPMVLVGAGGRTEILLLPVLTEDREAMPSPGPDADGRFDDLSSWSMFYDLCAGGDAETPMADTMRWARRMMSWALPADGETFERVYGGDVAAPAAEAHMIMLVLGLALHNAAFARRMSASIAGMDLGPVLAVLDPNAPDAAEQREVLRRTRPPGNTADDHSGRPVGTLRLTDVQRLEAASGVDWARWCDGAYRVLAEHTRLIRVRAADRHDALRPPLERLVTLQDLVPRQDDDLSWYTLDHYEDGDCSNTGSR